MENIPKNLWQSKLLWFLCDTYEWMNVMNFTSSYESMFQTCFQCIISMCKMYKLWMNNFCTISITKSWDAEFVMYRF
jgi:hypothetical protein